MFERNLFEYSQEIFKRMFANPKLMDQSMMRDEVFKSQLAVMARASILAAVIFARECQAQCKHDKQRDGECVICRKPIDP